VSAASTTYRFGPFVADSASYRLLRSETAIALSPKALDLLLLFAGRPATLFTKDEILDKLWPDVAVTDNALTQVISELRQALGDNPASPEFIETVPRRGYRFIAAVEKRSAPASVEGASQVSSGTRTIAVMDFTNVTGDADLAWLSAGIAETVTNDLRSIRELRVLDRGRHAVAYAKGTESIADALVAAGASDTVLVLEESSVLAAIRADANRLANADHANLVRTSRAAHAQLAAVRKLDLDALPEDLRELASLRLRHPTASISDLARRCRPPKTKASAYRRLRRLQQLAE